MIVKGVELPNSLPFHFPTKLEPASASQHSKIDKIIHNSSEEFNLYAEQTELSCFFASRWVIVI